MGDADRDSAWFAAGGKVVVLQRSYQPVEGKDAATSELRILGEKGWGAAGAAFETRGHRTQIHTCVKCPVTRSFQRFVPGVT